MTNAAQVAFTGALAEELASAYVLLASDDGSYMSGAVVPVTGGKHL